MGLCVRDQNKRFRNVSITGDNFCHKKGNEMRKGDPKIIMRILNGKITSRKKINVLKLLFRGKVFKMSTNTDGNAVRKIMRTSSFTSRRKITILKQVFN